MGACIDLTGKSFGELTVLSKTDRRSQSGGVYWLCKCSCGNTKEVSGATLRNGRSISCGCVRRKNLEIGRGLNFVDCTGKTFGKLKVIRRVEDKIINGRRACVQWECECECGNRTFVLASNLANGNSQSCGFCANNSHGNIKIESLLKSANIKFEREKRFKSCKDIYELPFDFFVNNTYAIEYDGKQHYKEDLKYSNASIQRHDKMKSEWCRENNIPLIRIPYTHYKDLCLEDLLLETSKFVEYADIKSQN